SLDHPEEFWARQAKQLDWYKEWDRVLKWENQHAKWFDGGLINVCYNCVDRHAKTSSKNKVAIIWEGENGDSRGITYHSLYREVNKLASALKELGVTKGTTVALYMPMIPELPIAMLACARLGAPFTQVYSGFSAGALTERMQHMNAKIVIMADGLWRRGNIVDLKVTVDKALEECSTVDKCIVVKRTGHTIAMEEGRDLWYDEALALAKEKYVAPEPLPSDHTLYVLYTSGTTAKPKGIQVGTGGYLTFVCSTLKWAFDIDENDVWWCAADIGWVTGHSYIVFGPLALGSSLVMYEGAPEYPDPGRIWKMVEEYGVTKFYTSPTLLRLLIKFGDEWPMKYDLNTLKILGSVGEPINPEVWKWFYSVIGKERCPISDTWWQTETGGFMISPAPGIELAPLKPGSATFPMPGVDPLIVDEEGKPLPAGIKGYLTIRKPWPGMLLTLYKDDERYQQYYWNRYPGAGQDLFYTGDYAIQDADGYYWLLGRSDDVLKVAGHRLGTIELEDTLVSHPAVAEASVVGKKDEIKGEVPIGFVVLKTGYQPSKKLAEELNRHVKKIIGPIATFDNIIFVPSLPKTRSGKIMRRVIKALVDGESVGDVTALEDKDAVDQIIKSLGGSNRQG
ncbi:MAG TPA: acetate--CoA ligase, partial [Candidatus Bathyarchaeia archaeon]|nr:acetate--CoA ligase [Candidatus Bathyarchaeia archaeon]